LAISPTRRSLFIRGSLSISAESGIYPPFSQHNPWYPFWGILHWQYDWNTLTQQAFYNGTPAQNNWNPVGTFTNHVALKVLGTYYDPSYGRTYKSADDFRTQSVPGAYYLLPNKTAQGEFLWEFSKKVVMKTKLMTLPQ